MKDKKYKHLTGPKPGNPDKPLSPKERKFLAHHLSGKNLNESVKLAGYKTTTQPNRSAVGRDIMNRPHVQTALGKLMEAKGIGDDYLVDLLKNHMEQKVLGATASTSLKALEDAVRWKGHEVDRKQIDYRRLSLDLNKPVASLQERLDKAAIINERIVQQMEGFVESEL